ncbi:MAG: FAD:protein FMN transferase [Desulforhopalus sp.]
MENEKKSNKRLSRRGFLQIVAVAGAAVGCWKLGLFGAAEKLQVVRRSQPIMGTILNLTIYGPDRDQCEEAVTEMLATMQGLEAKMSRHMASSDLSTLNRTGLLQNPDKDLLKVLNLAQTISRQSSGSFDVTILPLLTIHEEGNGNTDTVAAPHYNAAKSLVGYEKLIINQDKLQLRDPGMRVSLDGIGKGYIVDKGIASLKNYGFHNVFVEAGGDLMVSGRKEDNSPWRIGIRNPRPEQKRKLVTLQVSDKAVATSGDYFQPFTPDFKNHHIIDPRSGFSPPELASCTVTAPSVALADGLATAVMVLGKDATLDLLEPMGGCEAYMVTKDLKEYHTTGFFS